MSIVVVGVDGSANARVAALRAVEILGPQATFALVAVAPPDAFPAEKRALDRALERTQNLVEEAGAATTRSLREGVPAEELIAAADEHDALAIVVGARGAEMFMPDSVDGRRLGSVCLDLLQRRRCDVVVMSNPEAIPLPPGAGGELVASSDDEGESR